MRLRRSFWRRKGSPLSCREVGFVIQGYLDHELDPEDVAAVGEHLEACRRCGLEKTTYERIKASVSKQAPPIDEQSVDRLREFGAQLARGEIDP